MSKSIDERVVEMQFDNQQFEKGINTSVKSLDKLKKSLQLDDAGRSFEKLERSAKNVRLDGLAASVDAISSKFTLMGRMSIAWMDNIANAAVNAGKRIVNALTVDPVRTGFNEYELKMDAIKTIMNGSKRSLEDVTKALDELNKYADDTIYSFSDMTSNIGKFVNNNVELEDAVAAMKGISNAAALAGQGATQASSAMYNFSQSLSSFLNTRDWLSIENANMATYEMRKAFLDTAVEVGTLQKVTEDLYKTIDGKHEVTVAGFRDTLQYQWGTKDVIIKTLKKYSDTTTELGQKAMEAATQVRTLSKMWDALKEAAQSGWGQTWEIVFGNIDEATKLFTGMSEAISEVLEKQTKTRNEVLQTWKDLGGRDSIINAVANSFNSLRAVLGEVGEGFKMAFPVNAGEWLVSMSKKIEDFTQKIKTWLWSPNEFDGDWPVVASIRKSLSGVFSLLGIGGEIVSRIWNTLKNLFPFIGTGIKFVLGLTSALGETLTGFYESIKNGTEFDFFGVLREKISKLGDVGQFLADSWAKVKDLWGKGLDNIGSFFDKIPNLFSENGLGKLLAGASMIGKIVAAIVAIKKVKGLFSFGEFLSSIGEGFEGFKKFGLFGQVRTMTSTIIKLAGAIGLLLAAMVMLAGVSWEDLGKVGVALAAISGAMIGVYAAIKAIGPGGRSSALLGFAAAMALLVIPIKALAGLGWEQLAKAGVGLAAVSGILIGLLAATNKVGADGKSVVALIGLATALNFLIAPLVVFSLMSWEGLAKAGVALLGLSVALSLLLSAIQLGDGAKDAAKGAAVLLLLAGALTVLMVPLATFALMSWEGLAKAGVALMGLSVAISLLLSAVQLGGGAKDSAKGAAVLLLLAGALTVLMVPLTAFALMSWEGLAKAGVALMGLSVALSLLLSAIQLGDGAKDSLKGAAVLLLLAGALTVLMAPLTAFALMSWEGLAKAGVALMGLSVAISLLLSAIQLGDGVKDSAKGAAVLLALAAGLTLLMPILTELALMSWGGLARAGVGLLGISAALAVLMKVSKIEASLKGVAILLAFGLALSLLVEPLAVLTGFTWNEMGSMGVGLLAIAGTMLVLSKIGKKRGSLKSGLSVLGLAVSMAGMLWVFSQAIDKIKNVDYKVILAFSAGFAGAILALTGAIAVLGNLNIGTILQGCLGLVAIATALGGAVYLLLKISGGGIVDFSRDLLLIGGNLGEFANRVKDLDPDKVSLVGDAVSSLAKVFGANYFKSLSSSAILSMTGKATLVASDLNEFCRRLTSYDAQKIENACGSITTLSDTLADVTDNSSTVEGFASSLTSVGGGLQNFMSSIAGYGIVGAVKVQNARKTMNSIREMAVAMQETTGIAETITDVSVATTNLGSAINLYNKMAGGLSAVDGANVDPSAVGIGIAAMMRSLVEELPDDDTVRQIASYAGNGETGGNMTNFALGLNAIATAMSDYGEECKNLKLVPVMLGNLVLDQVSKIPDKLGKEGGLLQWFTGQTASLSEFATNLASVGTGLGNFVQGTTGISSEGVTVAGQALDMLIDRQDKLNTTSNFWTTLTGKSLGDFSTNFTRLGDGLKGFYNSVKGIRSFNTVGSFLVLDALIERQGSLNQLAQIKRGFDSWDLDLFSSQFANLGLNLSSMYSNIAGIDTSKAQDAVVMIQDFINMEKDLAKIGSEGSLEDFGGRISTLGENLESFSTSLTNFTPDRENLSSLFVIMNKFIALQGQLNEITASSDKMTSFSSVLTQTSDYINSFAGTGGISTGNVQVFEQAASGIEHIAQAIQSASGLSYGDGANLIDVIQGFIEAQTFDKWTLAGSDLISNMLKGMATEFENGWVSLNTSVTTLMDNVIVAVTGYESDFVTSGRNFTYGVARGIGDSGAVRSAVNAAVSVARKALSALNSALDEHSPSRLTAMSGRFFTQGFTQGLLDNSAGAVKASGALGTAIIDSFNDALGVHSPSKKTFDSAVNTAEGWIKGWKNKKLEMLDEVKDLGDSVIKTVDKLGNTIGDFGKKTGSTIADTTSTAFDKIKDLVNKSGFDAVEDLLNRTGASAEEKRILEYLRIFGDSQKDGLPGLTDSAKSDINEAINKGRSGVSKAAVDMAKIASIFDAIGKIGASVDLLGSKVSSMQIVMDSGELVGSIENKIDSRLGTLTALRGRGV